MGRGVTFNDYRDVSVKDSIISTYFGYHGWGDKEQGQWSVRQIPALYRKEILEPMRKALSPDTLAAWDTYITLKNADQPDPDKWKRHEAEHPADRRGPRSPA